MDETFFLQDEIDAGPRNTIKAKEVKLGLNLNQRFSPATLFWIPWNIGMNIGMNHSVPEEVQNSFTSPFSQHLKVVCRLKELGRVQD